MSFKEDGFEIIEGIISAEEAETIKCELAAIAFKGGGGIRNAEKKLQTVARLAKSDKLITLASKYLSGKARIVRSILFIKSIQNNWLVSWHQDKTVALSEKICSPEWGPWSRKDGVLHAQPPVEVLNQLVTFRVHLDDSTLENGCLKVIPNSHKEGILLPDSIKRYLKTWGAVHCEAPMGSALVMRPHILHASNKAESSQPRRVLHIEYSSYKLPPGIQWA